MSSIENPRGHEHIGDEFVTYRRHVERREPRSYYPPFPHNSKEDEEAHQEAERRANHEADIEAKRGIGDRYKRQKVVEKHPWTQKQPSCRFLTI
jgi:hypothetical protein